MARNGVVETDGAGISSSSYKNPKFDKLFEEIKSMENSEERLKKITEMIGILQDDAPWIWGYHPKSLNLYHQWYSNIFPNAMANNTLKYKKIGGEMRLKRIEEWNTPTLLPLGVFLLLLMLLGYALYRAYLNRERRSIKC